MKHQSISAATKRLNTPEQLLLWGGCTHGMLETYSAVMGREFVCWRHWSGCLLAVKYAVFLKCDQILWLCCSACSDCDFILFVSCSASLVMVPSVESVMKVEMGRDCFLHVTAQEHWAPCTRAAWKNGYPPPTQVTVSSATQNLL